MLSVLVDWRSQLRAGCLAFADRETEGWSRRRGTVHCFVGRRRRFAAAIFDEIWRQLHRTHITRPSVGHHLPLPCE